MSVYDDVDFGLRIQGKKLMNEEKVTKRYGNRFLAPGLRWQWQRAETWEIRMRSS